MIRLMVTQYNKPNAINMEIRFGPRIVTRFCIGPSPEFWNCSNAGFNVAESNRMISISGME